MPLTIFFPDAGNFTIDDDGIRGNNTSVIRDGTGAIIFTFAHPTDSVTFVTLTPGLNLTFNTTDSFGTANVTVGDLSNPGASPDSIIVRQMRTDGFMTLASNGTITEGGKDATADVTAAALVLSAVTGVGTPTNALEIQTTFIEAETNTGGINLVNFGQLQIGGITADVNGLNVVNSGNLNFLNYGPIFLADTTGTVIVHGGDLSGNVTLTAVGADADIYDTIDMPAIYAAGGGITLTAGRDVLLGLGGTNYNNDVLATGDIRINAGNDVLLDGTSNIRTGAFGGVVGGDVFVTAVRNISLTNTTGGLQTIEAFNGDVILTTGPGGSYFQQTAFSATVQTTGNIFLNTDNILMISGGLNTTGIGEIAVRPVTPGRPIDLGTTLDSVAALALSDAELDRFFTLNVSIGDAATGNVDFSAPLSPILYENLSVQSGNDILLRASLTLSRTLMLHAGDDLFISPTASFTSTNEGFTAFVDNAQDDDNLGALGNLDGTLSVNGDIRLNGNLDADTLNGGAADDMLMGNAGNDFLTGRGGADLLNGGLGRDIMTGGTEDDIYIVDSSLDVTTELAGEGFDTVQSSITHTLAADVEKLVLTGTAAINGNGNGLDNMIFGNAGANLLDGKSGVDQLRGGGGDDILVVQDVGDSVVELAGGGTDLVRSSVTFTLSSNVENLTLQGGAAAINGTGNTLANVITGNVGANILSGAGGADTMIGLAGNDTYIVDNAGDVVTEAAAGGTADKVQSSVNYTLGAELEQLTLTGAAVSGTGNALANTIIGNNAANSLDGADGADILKGGNNADTLDGDLGNDDLFGGVGNDDLIGGAGLDKYRFDTALSAVNNVDDILDYSVADDSIYLDRLVFTGIAADGPLSAAAVRLGTAALDADDRIIYDSATGNIFYDSDGIGAAAQILFASVDSGTALTRLDFFAYTGP